VANAAAARTTKTKAASNAPRSRKGVRTRARLIDAAKQVFERDGFLDARIVDIAETADLAPGSFYHYFDSKEQIFLEVAEAQEARLRPRPRTNRARAMSRRSSDPLPTAGIRALP
jgi:AcrR family transcriptional regulator